jgi:uncharacterized protein
MPDSPTPSAFVPSARSRVRRHPERAQYDRDAVFAILDAALLCHVGYVIDGLPYVTPTLFWREGERLYWHGSSASRMLRQQAAGIPVSVTVSHMDGLVLARSAFYHSMNYRAVMAFGQAHIVTDPKEKEAGFNAFVERLYPGRTRVMRAILAQEIKATTLMSMVIEEASAKIRDDGPLDLESDHASDCWAGVIPIAQRLGAPVGDQRVPPRGNLAREIGHFTPGAALDQVLLSLARRQSY